MEFQLSWYENHIDIVRSKIFRAGAHVKPD